jgi:hypothetical protein
MLSVFAEDYVGVVVNVEEVAVVGQPTDRKYKNDENKHFHNLRKRKHG